MAASSWDCDLFITPSRMHSILCFKRNWTPKTCLTSSKQTGY